MHACTTSRGPTGGGRDYMGSRCPWGCEGTGRRRRADCGPVACALAGADCGPVACAGGSGCSNSSRAFHSLLMETGIILLSPHGHRHHSIVSSWSQASFYCLLMVTGIILLSPQGHRHHSIASLRSQASSIIIYCLLRVTGQIMNTQTHTRARALVRIMPSLTQPAV